MARPQTPVQMREQAERYKAKAVHLRSIGDPYAAVMDHQATQLLDIVRRQEETAAQQTPPLNTVSRPAVSKQQPA